MLFMVFKRRLGSLTLALIRGHSYLKRLLMACISFWVS